MTNKLPQAGLWKFKSHSLSNITFMLLSVIFQICDRKGIISRLQGVPLLLSPSRAGQEKKIMRENVLLNPRVCTTISFLSFSFFSHRR